MSIMTLEIMGNPVACIYAGDRAEAERIAQQSWFHRDLLSHRSGGAPLWDGSTRLSLRHSTPRESEIVEKRFEAHHLRDKEANVDKGAVVFLVPLDQERNGHAADDDWEGDDFPI